MLLLCAITDATLLSCCNSYCVVPSRILRYHCYRSVCHCIPSIVIIIAIPAVLDRIGSVGMHGLYFTIPTMGDTSFIQVHV